MTPFVLTAAYVFGGLIVAAALTRIAYAISHNITRAPVLDIFISLFTWVPWAAGYWLEEWPGVLAGLIGQFLSLHFFCLLDRAIRGKKGRTLTDAQNKVLGPLRNQFALWATTPAAVLFVLTRVIEMTVYPVVAWLAKLPTYRQGDWVNLSRHKYDGLIGYDLLWCWYCDWMTGLWALGSEMLRNIESFWCPIQFKSDVKNTNALTDFPDISKWADNDGTIEDAVRAFEEHYDGTQKNSWWGHPDRKKP
ncbi:MAG: hypothetical protein ABIS50_00415 [Luteolibacter sp.]|uniref:hypothetical protein n=1 Tax=Luteolibacter sp. TaxID=1962973 RepID=UPI0032656573